MQREYVNLSVERKAVDDSGYPVLSAERKESLEKNFDTAE
jgi:hypothetical protein